MATPVGHALAGYLIFSVAEGSKRSDRWSFLGLSILMAAGPDLDFIPGILLGSPIRYHQGVSHSLGFAIGMGFIMAIAYSLKRGRVVLDWGLFSLAYSSHLAIDLLGPSRSSLHGLPLLWPFYGRNFTAPVHILPGVHHAGSTYATTSDWITSLFDAYNIGAIAVEVALILPLIILVHYLQRQKLRRKLNILPKRGEY